MRLHFVSSGAETSATVMDGRMKIADEDETIKEAPATDGIHQPEAETNAKSVDKLSVVKIKQFAFIARRLRCDT